MISRYRFQISHPQKWLINVHSVIIVKWKREVLIQSVEAGIFLSPLWSILGVLRVITRSYWIQYWYSTGVGYDLSNHCNHPQLPYYRRDGRMRTQVQQKKSTEVLLHFFLNIRRINEKLYWRSGSSPHKINFGRSRADLSKTANQTNRGKSPNSTK